MAASDLKRYFPHIVALLMLVILFQWLHFSVYYGQPVSLSLVWSLVDWIVWFGLGLAWVLSDGFSKARLHNMRWQIVVFVLLVGPLQIVISSAIFQALLESDKSLLQSFVHLMNKRWLQNIFIASAMVSVAVYYKQKYAQKNTAVTDKLSDPGSEKIIVLHDGIHTYRLQPNLILAVVSAKNYISVFTADKEIVVRDTLKRMQQRLQAVGFIQVSRSALINLSAIEQVDRYSKSSFRVVLSNRDKINIGRTFVEPVLRCIQLSPQRQHSSHSPFYPQK